jgi:radical SAM-linked protein
MPRIIFATALPVGVESLGEIVDMEFVGRVTPTEVQERLNEKMSQGIRIVEAKEVPLDSSPSSVKPRSVYWIQLHPRVHRGEAVDKLKSALAEEELIVQQRRKGKERRVDIRPFIEKMEIKRCPPGDTTSGESNWFFNRVEEGRLRPQRFLGLSWIWRRKCFLSVR